MALVDNVRGMFSQAGQSAKDLSDVAKLNLTISSTEKELENVYYRIGKKVYSAYANNPLPEVEDLLKQASDLNATIDDCNNQIDAINSGETHAGQTCSNCGATITRGSAFCSSCGNSIKTAPKPVEKTAATNCKYCGSVLSATSNFCVVCGQAKE